jgi:fatty-acyl-CoA synthase
MYTYNLILKHILEHGVRWAPNQEIVYRDRMRYTYTDLYNRVHRLANALKSLGVKKGDKVAVLDWDSHRYLECYYAIPMMGAILHTVNVRLSPEDILYTMNHAEDDIVLVYSDFVPLIESIKDKLNVDKFVLLTDEEYETDLTDVEYESMLKEADAEYDFPDLDENTVATMSYTTGTTGRPKGVFFTHRQLVLHTLIGALTFSGYDEDLTFTSRDVYMPLTPMFHVHAWGVPYIATLRGTKQVYPGRYEPQMLFKLVMEEKVTISHCVPTILNMIVSAIPEGMKLPGWKMVIGGSQLPKGLAMKAAEKGIITIAGYGLSETCPLLTIAGLKPELADAGEDVKFDFRIKAGFPSPLVYVRVVDDEMGDVPRDGKSVGEIVVRAPWLTQAYYKDEEKTKELWEGGWLHTGDIGLFDEYGYLEIRDRLKDVIKSGGEWISSLTLEDLISLYPGVVEVAVIGVPDEKWGERPLAIVVPESGKQLSADEIREHLMKYVEEGKITKWAIPEKIIFEESLPKTSVGKIDKKILREKYRG